MQEAMTKKIRILVIDDEEIVRISCQKALIPAGYEVDTAASGKEGLELFEKDRYDLIIIDLKMPGIDGLELMAHIKRLSPEQNVMIMTGYDTIEHIVDSISLGATHYIEKPFTPFTLIERIKEALQM